MAAKLATKKRLYLTKYQLFRSHPNKRFFLWKSMFFVIYLASIHVFWRLFGTHLRFLALIWHPFTFFVAYLAPIYVFCRLFSTHLRFCRLFGTYLRFCRLIICPDSRFLILETPEEINIIRVTLNELDTLVHIRLNIIFIGDPWLDLPLRNLK